MKRRPCAWITVSFALFLGIGVVTGLCASARAWDCTSSAPALASTGNPQPVDNVLWRVTFTGAVELAKLQRPKIIFLGDSQFEWWPGTLWQKDLAPLGALNFGIHSDKTENLIWRYDHAEKDVWNATSYVILIGTNNISLGDSPRDTADGVRILLNTIQQHTPHAKIVLIGLLPRENGVNNWIRKAVSETNGYLKNCVTRQNLTYLDLSDLLQDATGNTNDNLGEDKLHLTPKGYETITPRLIEALAK